MGRGGGGSPGEVRGGFVSTLEKTDLIANRRDPLLSGLLASGPFLKNQLLALVEPHVHALNARDSELAAVTNI